MWIDEQNKQTTIMRRPQSDLGRCRRPSWRSRLAAATGLLLLVAPHNDDAANRPSCTTARRPQRRARPTAGADAHAAAGVVDGRGGDISTDAAARTGWKTGPAAVDTTC